MGVERMGREETQRCSYCLKKLPLIKAGIRKHADTIKSKATEVYDESLRSGFAGRVGQCGKGRKP